MKGRGSEEMQLVFAGTEKREPKQRCTENRYRQGTKITTAFAAAFWMATSRRDCDDEGHKQGSCANETQGDESLGQTWMNRKYYNSEWLYKKDACDTHAAQM